MWLFHRRRKILSSIDAMRDDISAFGETIVELQECVKKLTKSMDALKEDNKHLYEELHGKNRFIEDLLRQMIGGAVNSISGPKSTYRSYDKTESAKPASVMSTKEILEARKNGELPKLPG